MFRGIKRVLGAIVATLDRIENALFVINKTVDELKKLAQQQQHDLDELKREVKERIK